MFVMISLTHYVLRRYATIFPIKKPTNILELYSHSLFISTVPYNMNVSMYLFRKCSIRNVDLCHMGQSLLVIIFILFIILLI